MDIKLTLDTHGSAASGIDRGALVSNIQAEIQKLADAAAIAVPPAQGEKPPAGAQGDPTIWHWVLHFAEQPQMLKLYAQGLISGVNSIIEAAKGKSVSSSTEDPQPLGARLEILGKEILIPATTAAIKTFLDALNEGHHGS